MSKKTKILMITVLIILTAATVIYAIKINKGEKMQFDIGMEEVDYISLSNRETAMTVDDDVGHEIINLLNGTEWTARKKNSHSDGCGSNLSLFIHYKEKTYTEYYYELGTAFWFDETEMDGGGMIYTVQDDTLIKLAALAKKTLANAPSYENDTNPNEERLFNIKPLEVDRIELYRLGKTAKIDDENCRMIIELLNSAVWTSRQDRSATHCNNAYGIKVYYKDGTNEIFYYGLNFICLDKFFYSIGNEEENYFKVISDLSWDIFSQIKQKRHP